MWKCTTDFNNIKGEHQNSKLRFTKTGSIVRFWMTSSIFTTLYGNCKHRCIYKLFKVYFCSHKSLLRDSLPYFGAHLTWSFKPFYLCFFWKTTQMLPTQNTNPHTDKHSGIEIHKFFYLNINSQIINPPSIREHKGTVLHTMGLLIQCWLLIKFGIMRVKSHNTSS